MQCYRGYYPHDLFNFMFGCVFWNVHIWILVCVMFIKILDLTINWATASTLPGPPQPSIQAQTYDWWCHVIQYPRYPEYQYKHNCPYLAQIDLCQIMRKKTQALGILLCSIIYVYRVQWDVQKDCSTVRKSKNTKRWIDKGNKWLINPWILTTITLSDSYETKVD